MDKATRLFWKYNACSLQVFVTIIEQEHEVKWAMTVGTSSNEYNRELFRVLDLGRKNSFAQCLVEEGCKGQPVSGHSVPRSMLKTISAGGEVIGPKFISEKDSNGRAQMEVKFVPRGIGLTSTGYFSCAEHEKRFAAIDVVEADWENPKVLDLLFFRTAIWEMWQLEKLKPTEPYQPRRMPIVESSLNQNVRLDAIRETVRLIRPHLTRGKSPLTHIVRRVKSDHPIVTAACVGAAKDVGLLNEQRIVTRPTAWTFSVVPRKTEHVIIASCLTDSTAPSFISHFREVNGRELEAAVSGELIIFGENWFVHPKVWDSYNSKKRAAILSAFDNFEKLSSGGYAWRKRKPDEPWYKFLKMPNRHQLNLFQYNRSALS